MTGPYSAEPDDRERTVFALVNAAVNHDLDGLHALVMSYGSLDQCRDGLAAMALLAGSVLVSSGADPEVTLRLWAAELTRSGHRHGPPGAGPVPGAGRG